MTLCCARWLRESPSLSRRLFGSSFCPTAEAPSFPRSAVRPPGRVFCGGAFRLGPPVGAALGLHTDAESRHEASRAVFAFAAALVVLFRKSLQTQGRTDVLPCLQTLVLLFVPVLRWLRGLCAAPVVSRDAGPSPAAPPCPVAGGKRVLSRPRVAVCAPDPRQPRGPRVRRGGLQPQDGPRGLHERSRPFAFHVNLKTSSPVSGKIPAGVSAGTARTP